MKPSTSIPVFYKIYLVLSSVAILFLFYLVVFNAKAEKDDVITTRGIIVLDENGKERILIGAPIPFAQNRVRTDTLRARESWGYIHPDYMNFYKNYEHSTNGILILDDKGMDRIAIGDPAPDPNIGKRIAPSTGFVLNDKNGFERSGYGILTLDGIDRVNLGLDTNKGTEGLVLTVDDNGTAGLSIRSQKQNIFLGKADSTNWHTDGAYPFNGLIIQDSLGTSYEQNTYESEDQP